MGKGLSPQQMVLRKLNTAEKWNERLTFHHTQKATRRGSDLNVRPETVKLLAEHIRREPLNIALGSNFRIWHLKHKEERKIDTWGYVKFKSSCPAKGTINKTKRQPTEWEKYLYNHGQISPTFEDLLYVILSHFAFTKGLHEYLIFLTERNQVFHFYGKIKSRGSVQYLFCSETS